jgi:serine/threonine protein phosphatase PrpC
MRLEVGAETDRGQRKEANEDHYAVYLPGDSGLPDLKDGGLLVVADGLGGHFAGDVASKLAVTIMKDFLTGGGDKSESPLKLLSSTVHKANTQIHNANRGLKGYFRPMGTTLTTVFVEGDTAYYCHVGDSRSYLIRGAQIQLVTEDHSWVEEQVKMGLMTREEAKRDPRRHVLTRTLGTRPETQVDTYEKKLSKGDILVTCSDGLSNTVSPKEILAICNETENAQAAAEELIRKANERGAPDNVTVIVAVVEPERSKLASKKFRRSAKRLLKSAAKIVLFLAVLIGVFLLGHYVGRRSILQPVQTDLEQPAPSGQIQPQADDMQPDASPELSPGE